MKVNPGRQENLTDAEIAKLILIRLEAIRDNKYASKMMEKQALLDAIQDCKLIKNRKKENQSC
jgi:hypothetical protein